MNRQDGVTFPCAYNIHSVMNLSWIIMNKHLFINYIVFANYITNFLNIFTLTSKSLNHFLNHYFIDKQFNDLSLMALPLGDAIETFKSLGELLDSCILWQENWVNLNKNFNVTFRCRILLNSSMIDDLNEYVIVNW